MGNPAHLLAALGGSILILAGCGGSGGGGGGGNSSNNAAIPPASSAPVVATASNVLPITVNSGPAGSVNLAFASVTVCVPGSASACQTVDGILIDTGSTGLRIIASALGALALPQQTDASGNPVAECAQFADGSSWGPVKMADVKLSGKQASSLAIQVIGDPGFAAVPSGCPGRTRNTVSRLGANGILGVGSFRYDCGDACVQSTSPGIYYVCPSAGCTRTVRPLSGQVQQPVSVFAADNNGVVVQFPSVPDSGVASLSGTLTFGIATQSNNALGSAAVYTVDPLTGWLTTVYKGRTLPNSFIDSGSNAYFFQDSAIASCTVTGTLGFYCPPAPQSLSALIQGTNGRNTSIQFGLTSASSLFAGGGTAFNNLGAPNASFTSFDWGLPFFYGRTVFVAIEGAAVSGAPAGPFVAF